MKKNKTFIFFIFGFCILNFLLISLNQKNNKLVIEYAKEIEMSKHIKNIMGFYSIIPKEKEMIRLVSELPNLAKNSNLKISSIKYQPFKKEEQSSFKKLSFSIPVEGNYNNIRKFVYKIENLRKLIKIESISLKKEKEGSDIIGVELYVSTYFR
ncbi:MAG: type 4a pilus biogenesis protein PilO [Candidatus Firestonebacteria bacterium]